MERASLGLVYFAYRYNFLFVYNTQVDTKGLAYPRAWKQTLTGVYLAEGSLPPHSQHCLATC